eukprot:753509-Hanusia_phi.AAC.8
MKRPDLPSVVCLVVLLSSLKGISCACFINHDVQEFKTILSQHPSSPRAWEFLGDAFSGSGCSTEALLAFEISNRLYRSCMCSRSEIVEEAIERTRSKYLPLLHVVRRTENASCCRATVVIEQGGIDPILIEARFSDDDQLELARMEASEACPMYFGQCQQKNPFVIEQQDCFLHQIFGNKRNGIFVDVGSTDGFSFSNTFYFEQQLNWTGLCFEPNANTYDTLKRVRSKSKCYNACVGNTTGVKKFVQCTGYTRMLSGLLECMSDEHIRRIDREIMVFGGTKSVVDVNVVTLADIFRQENFQNVDLLSIDTEGAELHVLRGVDWDKINISIIILEMLDRNSQESREIFDFLHDRGYSQIGYVCQDIAFWLSSAGNKIFKGLYSRGLVAVAK